VKKCKHATICTFDSRENFEKRQCDGCGEWLSLGPSNDAPVEVQCEIRAAELALDERMDVDGFEEIDEELGRISHEYDDGLGWMTWCEWAGWLARQIATHDDEGGR
jgi:hypothetical protein